MTNPQEFMREWADEFKDNRVGPLLHAIIDAVVDCESPEDIRKIEQTMRFLSNSISSFKDRKFKNAS